MKKHILSLTFAALSFGAAAQATDESSLTASSRLFNCEDSFTNKGKGVCTQVLDVDFQGAPRWATWGKVTCAGTWKFRKERRPKEWQLRDVTATEPMVIQSGWGSVRLTLVSDFGSLADETLQVWDAGHRCKISYGK